MLLGASDLPVYEHWEGALEMLFWDRAYFQLRYASSRLAVEVNGARAMDAMRAKHHRRERCTLVRGHPQRGQTSQVRPIRAPKLFNTIDVG